MLNIGKERPGQRCCHRLCPVEDQRCHLEEKHTIRKSGPAHFFGQLDRLLIMSLWTICLDIFFLFWSNFFRGRSFSRPRTGKIHRPKLDFCRIIGLVSPSSQEWLCWRAQLWSVPEKKNVVFIIVRYQMISAPKSGVPLPTHLIELLCPSEKEIDFLTPHLFLVDRKIGVGWTNSKFSSSSMPGLVVDILLGGSKPIPESMLSLCRSAASWWMWCPLSSIGLASLLWRLVLVPTQRRSLAFKPDLPSPLSISLLARRSTKVELRLGRWVSIGIFWPRTRSHNKLWSRRCFQISDKSSLCAGALHFVLKNCLFPV